MRIYGESSDGERILAAIECDSCGKTARPGSEELLGEWIKTGWDSGPGTDRYENEYCGQCSAGR
jgi:hypothetical protein